jgi:hypothetical protein
MDTQSRRIGFDWRFWIALAVLIGLAPTSVYLAAKTVEEIVSDPSDRELWFWLLPAVFLTIFFLSLRPFGLWFRRFKKTNSGGDRASWRTQVKRGALVAWMFAACTLGSVGANLVLRSMAHDAHHSCIHRGAPFWSWSTLVAPPLLLLGTGVWAGRKVLSPKLAAVLASVWALATAVPTILAIADAAALTAAATIGGRYDLYYVVPATCSLVWGSVLLVLVLLTARFAIGRARTVRR